MLVKSPLLFSLLVGKTFCAERKIYFAYDCRHSIVFSAIKLAISLHSAKEMKQKLQSSTQLSLFSLFTYPLCHLVELEALASFDGEAFAVVFPGGEQEELSALAGFHALAAGLGEVGEAVLLKDDEGQAFLEGGTHHLLLAP